MDVDFVLDDLKPMSSVADDLAAFDAAARHPHAIGSG